MLLLRKDSIARLRNRSLLIALSLGVFGTSTFQVRASAILNEWYRSKSDDHMMFADGSIYPEENGYSLKAPFRKHAPQDEAVYVESFSRLDSSGSLLWNVKTKSDQVHLHRDTEDLDHFFAYAYLSEESIAIARLQGAELGNVYSFSYPVETVRPKVQISTLPDSRVGILQNLGGAVKLSVFGNDGTPVFENQYKAAGFLTSEVADTSFQTAKLHPLLNSSDYLITVLKTERNQAKGSYNNTFFLFRVSTTGQLIWAKSFAIATTSRSEDRTQIAGTDIVVALPDTTIGIPGQPSTSLPVTHVILISTEGVLRFSQAIEGLRYEASPILSSEDSLFISGSAPSPSTLFSTDAVMCELSLTDGSLLQQQGFDATNGESLNLATRINDTFYGTISSTEVDNHESVLLALDPSLQITDAKDGKGAILQVDPDLNLFVSSYLKPKAAISALTLSPSLTPLEIGAEPLPIKVPLLTNPNLLSRTIAADLLNLTVSTEAKTTTLSGANLELELFKVERYRGNPNLIPSPISSELVVTGSESASLRFYSEYGTDYQVQKSNNPSNDFETIKTLAGTGSLIEVQVSLLQSKDTFFKVIKID